MMISFRSIGRVRFFLHVLVINFVFLIPFRLALETDAEFGEVGLSLVVLFLYCLVMAISVEKRTNDIGVNWGNGVVATLWLFGSMMMGVWSLNASFSDDLMIVLAPQVANLIFGFSAFLFLLLCPSREVLDDFKERRALKKTKRGLLKKQELDSLRDEVKKLEETTSDA